MDSTTCAIAGGGPAGLMLGLLLARAGVDVVVLEKHADFLRDFRGDTVHPSTLTVLDDLGLGGRFATLPQRHVTSMAFDTEDGAVALADFGRLRHPHPYVAFVPQWDFLTLLADEARSYGKFALHMRAEAYDLLREGGRVRGLRYRGPDGERELRADLTVAADGRHSALRRLSGLRALDYGAPMDVMWFRLPRNGSDPVGAAVHLRRGAFVVRLDRGDYWQIAYLVRKGTADDLRSYGIARLRAEIARSLPFLADRVGELRGWEDVSTLGVRVDRLARWYLPGLLFVGDAAHAMSPVGGVGINLAIQDAVAAANTLTEPLLRGDLPDRDLAAVQARREVPTVLTQWFQRMLHAAYIGPVLDGERPPVPPAPVRALSRLGSGQRLAAAAIGIGVRPERVRTLRRSGIPGTRDG